MGPEHGTGVTPVPLDPRCGPRVGDAPQATTRAHQVAVDAGFEPADRVSPVGSLAKTCLKPDSANPPNEIGDAPTRGTHPHAWTMTVGVCPDCRADARPLRTRRCISNGGGCPNRTDGALTRSPRFKLGAIGRSANPPKYESDSPARGGRDLRATMADPD